jgi:hypothetical protein
MAWFGLGLVLFDRSFGFLLIGLLSPLIGILALA